MSIWFQRPGLNQLNGKLKRNMTKYLEIEFTDIGDDWLEATMPVNEKTTQPFDILHGGASCVLAETVGSVASNFCVDQEKFYAVGLGINANHLKSATQGLVKARAQIIHKGKKTHVWDIRIHDEKQRAICVSRLTMAIVPRED